MGRQQLYFWRRVDRLGDVVMFPFLMPLWAAAKLVPPKVWIIGGTTVALAVGVLGYGHSQRLKERSVWKAKEAAHVIVVAAENKKFADAKKVFDSEIATEQKESKLALGMALLTNANTTKSVLAEVKNALPKSTVDKYPLPVGFVRLVDAAAANKELPIGTATGLDANRSAVGVDAAASVTVRNLGRFFTAKAERDKCLADYDAVVGKSKAFAEATR